MNTVKTPISRARKVSVEARQLSVGYPDAGGPNVLFENLDLQLLSGTMTCFMGPNGIGKSTLLRTLLGMQPPLTGSVRFLGVDASQLDRARQVAAVLTERISALNMNVAELISFGRYPYINWAARMTATDHAAVDRAMELVHIENLAGKKVHTLSDGQLQMAMIARALAQDTPIIILDEPTAHLDLNNRLEVMTLLRQLAHTLDKTILVATHELDLALQTADLIWLATADKQILTGIPEDLVLAGTFDAVFQLKGFDLRTGKVEQLAHRGKTIRLAGSGHALLWTKNALERSGFSVGEQDFAMTVEIIEQDKRPAWMLKGTLHPTIASLLQHLETGVA